MRHSPRLSVLLAHQSELTLSKPGPVGVQLDLHWWLLGRVYYEQKLDLDWFLQKAIPIRIREQPGQTLGPLAQVLYLSAHYHLHHGGKGLVWLYDIAAVIDRYRDEIDWDELPRRAEQYGLVSSVYRVLRTLAEEWLLPLPADGAAGA